MNYKIEDKEIKIVFVETAYEKSLFQERNVGEENLGRKVRRFRIVTMDFHAGRRDYLDSYKLKARLRSGERRQRCLPEHSK